MRAWLYDTLTHDDRLQLVLGGVEGIKDRVVPRRSEESIRLPKPFVIYGLGNSTSEQLGDSTADDHEADRQFFQVWVHDEGGSYEVIDNMVSYVKEALSGQSHPPSHLITVIYLETSGEFSNETYGTNFRYIRFQAIIARGSKS